MTIFRIVTITAKWYFFLYTSEGISCTSETKYYISLTKAITKEENETELYKNVK